MTIALQLGYPFAQEKCVPFAGKGLAYPRLQAVKQQVVLLPDSMASRSEPCQAPNRGTASTHLQGIRLLLEELVPLLRSKQLSLVRLQRHARRRHLLG